MQKNKNGFKDLVCKDKSYLGCNSRPPSLSSKTIRRLSSSLCGVDASLVSDEALGKLKKSGAISKNGKKEAKNKKNKKMLPLDGVSNKDDEDMNNVDED